MVATKFTTNLQLTSNTSNLFTTAIGDYYVSSGTAINPGYMPLGGTYDPLAGYSLSDPLNQRPPRPETPEQWLRRRVHEVQWRAA